MITWQVTVIILGHIVAFCFLAWLRWRREMEKEHHKFQERGFALEERKFDVWKTMNFAQASQQGKDAKDIVQRALRSNGTTPSADEIEPNPGKVVSMFDKKRERGPHGPTKAIMGVGGIGTATVAHDGGVPTQERMAEVAEALMQAREMPPGPQRDAFLKEHGIDHAEFEDENDGPKFVGPGSG